MQRTFLLIVTGAKAVLNHPRVLLGLFIAVVFPVLLAFVMHYFLSTAGDNAASAARLRTGTIHDVLRTLILTLPETTQLASAIATLQAKNPDFTDMVVAYRIGDEVAVVAPTTTAPERLPLDATFTRAHIAPDTPVSFEFYDGIARVWETTSSFADTAGVTWYVVTRQHFSDFDALIAAREWYAYSLLLLICCFLVTLGYWLVRDIDYRAELTALQAKFAEQGQITNMIAHELRAPLTAMRGYASMIGEQQPVGTPVHTYAVRIDEATERLLRIVNDFLEMARLQSGQLQLTLGAVAVAEVVQKVCDEVRPLATAKALELSVRVPDEPVIITSDHARLHQILTNITSNAIKYTASGRVTLELTSHARFVEIRIKDTGAGISAEHQQKLFTPFFRVENADTSKITGTGLGMWITKQLTTLLGGTIGVESIKDVGTNIVLTFPCQATPPK